MASVAELKKTVKGLVMPIPAVFDGKGEPDLPMMEKLTDWYLDSGVHGFFILGSQGQGPATTIVHLDVGGQSLVASITTEAARELGLAEGSEVVAVIKASDVMVATRD